MCQEYKENVTNYTKVIDSKGVVIDELDGHVNVQDIDKKQYEPYMPITIEWHTSTHTFQGRARIEKMDEKSDR